MKKRRLGLPFEYKKEPEYFDALTTGEQKDFKNNIIEKLLKEHKVKTVLDLTCGTGSQIFYLHKNGYKVVGADFSPELIKQAQEKAKKEKIEVQFFDGDMRTFKAGQFDAVITIDNAIGHLTKIGFEKTLCNIRKNLHDGGIYIFDILNSEVMTDDVVKDLKWHVKKIVDDSEFSNNQYSTFDKEAGLLTSYDTYTITKSGAKSKTSKSTFSLQIYTAQESREILSRNRFEIVDQYGFDGLEFVEDKSLSILTVARKQ